MLAIPCRNVPGYGWAELVRLHIGASSVMTVDAGATANSGRAAAAIPEPLNTPGAGGVIPREIFFPRKRLVYLVQKGFLGSTA